MWEEMWNCKRMILLTSVVGTFVDCRWILLYMNVSACVPVQSCQTLCDSMDCSPPGSSVQGIFQARILKWVAISFSKGSSPARDETCISGVVSCIGRWILYHWATWKAPYIWTVREKEVSFSAWAISLKGLLLPSSKEATGIALRWTTPLLKHNTLKKYKNI